MRKTTWKFRQRKETVPPADSEPVGDLDYMEMPVSAPPLKPDKRPDVVGSYSRVPPASATPPWVAQRTPKPVYVPHKTGVEHAQDVMRDLPLGKVVHHKTGEPVTKDLSTRDLGNYANVPSKTQQKMMDHLVSKGVVQKRPNRAALVNEAYRYNPKPDPKADQIIDVGKALEGLGIGKSEARQYAESSDGDSLDSHINNALKMVGSK